MRERFSKRSRRKNGVDYAAYKCFHAESITFRVRGRTLLRADVWSSTKHSQGGLMGLKKKGREICELGGRERMSVGR